MSEKEIFKVDIYDEWHNLKGTKSFNSFEKAKLSGLKVLEEDKTEQLLGFGIFDKNDKIICTKYHNEDMEFYNKNYIKQQKYNRFEIMDI